MLNFDYQNKTRFLFGRGHEDNVGNIIKGYGANNVMILHYGTGMQFENDLIDRIIKSITDAGLKYYDFSGIERADIESADKASRIVKDKGVDFLLPVGGGAVIDIAKYVAVDVNYEGNTWDDLYIGNGQVPEPMMIGAISTVAASGSENSPDSVIGKGELKRTMSDSKLRPLFAVMDPELLSTLPAKITAAGAADMMGHADERYFSLTPDNMLTDLLNEACIKTIIKYGPICYREPDNYEARAQILWAGVNAHNGGFEVGRVPDRAVHCIESEIGGKYHSIHGMGIGCVTFAWAKFMCTRDIPKFSTYFNHIWDVPMDMRDVKGMFRTGLERMEAWYKSMDVPTNLADLGVKEEDIPGLVATTRTMPDGTIGGYSKLTKEDLTHIYMIGLGKEIPEVYK